MTATKDSCKARVMEHYRNRFSDIRRLLDDDNNGGDGLEGIGSMSEYGLSFDYCKPKNRRGYFRYQISWGGPSEEIRFYVDYDGSLQKAEFWLLDWFDGAHVTPRGKNADTARELFSWLTGDDPEVLERMKENAE